MALIAKHHWLWCIAWLLASGTCSCSSGTSAKGGDAGTNDQAALDAPASHDAFADATVDSAVIAEGASGDQAPLIAPDAARDASAPFSCEAGDYFVTVNDGTGTQVLRGACTDSGPNVPSALVYGVVPSGEIAACSSGLQFSATASTSPQVGSTGAYFTYDFGGGFFQGLGTLQWTAVPTAPGGTLAGEYASEPLRWLDGGAAGFSVSGTFCVLLTDGGSGVD